MKKSWKTTVGGVIAFLGQALLSMKPFGDWSEPAGQALTGLGALILGVFARDEKVTSESAGAK